jgi:hypothetical protein
MRRAPPPRRSDHIAGLIRVAFTVPGAVNTISLLLPLYLHADLPGAEVVYPGAVVRVRVATHAPFSVKPMAETTHEPHNHPRKTADTCDARSGTLPGPAAISHKSANKKIAYLVLDEPTFDT